MDYRILCRRLIKALRQERDEARQAAEYAAEMEESFSGSLDRLQMRRQAEARQAAENAAEMAERALERDYQRRRALDDLATARRHGNEHEERRALDRLSYL